MYHYEVFGGRLSSDMPFPDLRATDDGAGSHWRLRTAESSPVARAQELIGTEATAESERVDLYRFDGGYRLAYTDTGTFDIDVHGSNITWHPVAGALPELVRADVLGRVLAVALHADGLLCLHGSAVALGAGAVAFLAPKHHGKSTLATALTAAGARLLTDDTVAVRLGAPPMALPGVHSVRLCADSSERLAGRFRGGETIAGIKQTLTGLPDANLMLEAVPLRGVYLLTPVRVTEGTWAARRLPMAATPAALALVRHAKIGALLGAGAEAPALLERASGLADSVPVYMLQVERDWTRLDEVVAQVMGWHGGAACAVAAGMAS